MIGYQPLHLQHQPLLWPYHNHSTWRMSCQTYPVVCIYVFQEELGKGERSSRNLRRVWFMSPFLSVKLTLLWCPKDSNGIQQYFSAEKHPTLWCALPTIEELQSAWKAKQDDAHFSAYWTAINDRLAKLSKYYSWFDKKPAYVIALGISFFTLWASQTPSTYWLP